MARHLSPNEWRQLDWEIDRLLDAAPEQRSALLAQLTRGDDARRAELEQLVAECERAWPLLDKPAVERFGALLDSDTTHVPALLAERYYIVRELARGGMAIVYLARDRKHDRDVAVKVIRPEVAITLGRTRFLREIAIAAQLKHPHIVPLFDSGEVAGLLYYVMPYQEEQSLRERLKRAPALQFEECLSILSDVSDALAYAHQQGVVHRDIKPENVLLAGRHALITDFGVARAVTAAAEQEMLTTAGGVVGTAAYMAPEQQAGTATVDHRADIYAVGVMAYEMLLGARPFSTELLGNAQLEREQIAAEHITRARSDIPEQLAQLIASCLASQPAARPQSALELLAAVDRSRVVTTADAQRTAGYLTPVRRLRQHPWLTAAVALTVLGVVALPLVKDERSPPTEAPRQTLSVGILPVAEASPGGQLSWLSKGLENQLSLELTGVPGLEVRPTEVIASYTALSWPLDSIAVVRNVDYFIKATLSHGGRDSVAVALELIEGGLRSVRAENAAEALQRENLVQTLGARVAQRIRPMLGTRIRERQLERAPTNALALQQRRRAEHHRLLMRTRIAAGDLLGGQSALDSADALLLESQRRDPRWPAPRLARAGLSSWRALLVLLKPGDSDHVGVRRVLNAGLAIVDSALQITPNDAQALALRGRLRRERAIVGETDPQARRASNDSAERDLLAAISRDSMLARPTADLAAISFSRGDYHDAAGYADRAYRVDAFLEDASEIINILALSDLEINEDRQAERWCAEGIRRFPAEYIHRGCALDVMAWGSGVADVDSAWSLYRAVEQATAAFNPADQAQYLATVGAVLARSSSARRDSAQAVLRRARDLIATNPNVTSTSRARFLAVEAAVLFRLGDSERANSLVAELRREDATLAEQLLRRRSLRSFVPATRRQGGR